MYESHVTSSTRLLHFGEVKGKRENANIASGGTNMSRFVEPYRFSETERKALFKLLRKCKAGDEEGRRILVIATEYEIGLCRDLAEHSTPEEVEPERVETSVTLEPNPIAEMAIEFGKLLRSATDSTRKTISEGMTETDPFGRQYNENYLEYLAHEVERLATAAGPQVNQKVEIRQPIPDYIRLFVHKMGEIYHDCLVEDPSPEEGSAFYQFMETIRTFADFKVQLTPGVLKDLLESERKG